MTFSHKTHQALKKISLRWKCHRVLPPVISLRAFLTHYMTGWKIVLYRFAVKRETRWREKASRCFFWGASMKRLRRVRALGERSLKWQGLIKSIFVGRNNTSVRGEITEGASIPSKNNYTPNTSSRSTTPPTARPQIAWRLEWQLRWGECAIRVPCRDERWQPVKRDKTGLCGSVLAPSTTGVLFTNRVCKPFGKILPFWVNP